ncbi:DUF1707 SHOCT-like domain-containing protein [Nocardia lasii]|uniref:DUF1707 domain-containing protein n=1 Tax=Nocardia lasii TaxID=1616107 RepID=A0ABW1JR88_9NOCA
MAEPLPDDDLRVGNPERERAIGLLVEAFSAGYLDVAEFEERSALAYTARTRGDLRRVLAQLPTAVQLFPEVVAEASPAVLARFGAQPVVLSAEWTTVRRKGVWHPPARMLFTGSFGTVDLDFVKAEFEWDTVDVEVQMSVSTVKVMVGPDQEIQYGGVDVRGWSSLKDKAGPPKRPGGPTIRLFGVVSRMSGIVLKRR